MVESVLISWQTCWFSVSFLHVWLITYSWHFSISIRKNERALFVERYNPSTNGVKVYIYIYISNNISLILDVVIYGRIIDGRTVFNCDRPQYTTVLLVTGLDTSLVHVFRPFTRDIKLKGFPFFIAFSSGFTTCLYAYLPLW